MMPYFKLILMINPQHSRPHKKKTILDIELLKTCKGCFEDVQNFLIRNIAKLAESIGYPFHEEGTLLIDPTYLIRIFMGEIVQRYSIIILHSKFPHISVFDQLLLIVD